LQTANRLEHEEVEKHQSVLKIIDPDEAQSSDTRPNQ
jgi:hypothetical protein